MAMVDVVIAAYRQLTAHVGWFCSKLAAVLHSSGKLGELSQQHHKHYKYKYNSYFYCAPYSLTDGALQKSANTCFTAVGRLK